MAFAVIELLLSLVFTIHPFCHMVESMLHDCLKFSCILSVSGIVWFVWTKHDVNREMGLAAKH